MKIVSGSSSHSLLLLLCLSLTRFSTTIHAYFVGGPRVYRRGGVYPSTTRRFRHEMFEKQQQQRRQQDQQVEQAFSRLQQELASDEAAQKQKELVKKTFDFWNELNEEYGNSSTQEETSQMLQKTRRVVDQVVEFASQLNRDLASSSSQSVNQDAADNNDDYQSDKNTSESSTETPKFHVEQTPEATTWYVELPGVLSSDVNVQVEEQGPNATLVVTGTRYPWTGERRKPDDTNAQERQLERLLHVSFALDDTVDADQLTAKLQAGILTVRVPKKNARPQETKTTRVISIHSNEGN